MRTTDGTLTNEPQAKAGLLQEQYVNVFSEPEMADVEECLVYAQPGINSDAELIDLTFTGDIINAIIAYLDPYSASPDGEMSPSGVAE